MRKVFSSVFIFGLLSFSAQAYGQDEIVFGGKAALNLSNMSDGYKTRCVRYQFGVTVDFSLTDNLYLMSGLNLQTKGGKKNLDRDPETDEPYKIRREVIANPMYLQLPLSMGYKIHLDDELRILFNAGPYVAFGVGGKSKLSYKEDRVTYAQEVNYFGSGRSKRFDVGISAGFGVEINKMVLFFGYDYGLIGSQQAWTNSKAKNKNVEISVGFKIQ